MRETSQPTPGVDNDIKLRDLLALKASRDDFIGWRLAKDGEVVPYQVALVGPKRAPTQRDLRRGRELDRRVKKRRV